MHSDPPNGKVPVSPPKSLALTPPPPPLRQNGALCKGGEVPSIAEGIPTGERAETELGLDDELKLKYIYFLYLLTY